MPDSGHSPEPNLRAALDVYAAHLQRSRVPNHDTLDALCAEHPLLADEFRKLNDIVTLAQSLARSESFHQTIREVFGEETEVRLALDENDPTALENETTLADSTGDQQSVIPGTDRYTLQSEVARGGMGVVYKVRDCELNRNLAMKVMLGAPSLSHRMGEGGRGLGEGLPVAAPTPHPLLARFLEEVQVTAQLDHPGIVAVHELGLDAAGRPYFTMKLVKGRDLSRIFELARAEQEGWNLPRAIWTLIKACQAVAFAHSKGVIHRDLKPANIMVGRFGEVYVMDWGLAKVTGRKDLHDLRLAPASPTTVTEIQTPRGASGSTTADSPLITMDGSVVGTPAYMPPEQAKGQVEQVDAQSDVYSLGAILYNLLTGQAPYVETGARLSPHTILARVLDGPPKRIHMLNSKAPAELIAICEKAMAREKRDRYRSSLDLAEELQAYLDNRVVKAYRTGAVAEFKSWVVRNRAAAITGAAALVLTVLFSALYAGRERANAFRLKDGLARQYLRRGVAICEQGDMARGLHWIVRSFKEAPTRSTALMEDIRMTLASSSQRWNPPRAMLTSESGVAAIALSPDGRIAVTGDNRGRVQFWSGQTGELLPRTLQHTGVAGIAFSPDGKRVVTVGQAVTRLWIAETGAPVGEPIRDPGVFRASFSSDGARVLTSGVGSKTARLWDSGTGRQVGADMDAGGRVWNARLSPDGHRVLTASGGNVARLWDAETGRQIGADLRHGHEVVDVAFSPDGKLAVTASQDRTARLWDAQTGEAIGTPLVHGREVWSAAFSPDGLWVATGSLDGTTRLWKATTGEASNIVLVHSKPVKVVGFSPDGEWLFTVCVDRSIRVWSTKTWQLLYGPMHHEDELSAVELQNRTFLTRSGPRAFVWSIDDAPKSVVTLYYRTPKPEYLTPEAVAFSPDGKRLLMGDWLGQTWWWTLDSGQVAPAPFRHDDRIWGITFSADGKRILTASGDGRARLWSMDNGERQITNFVHRGAVHAARFSPNGEVIATASDDRNAGLWSAESGRRLCEPLVHPDRVADVAFSPDGTLVATACADGAARLWSTKTGKQVGPLLHHQRGLHAVTFSPNGKLLATCGADNTTRLWHVVSGQPTGVILEHKGVVVRARFSADGRLLATAAEEGDDAVRLWSPVTGELLGPPLPVWGGLTDLAFSLDGTRVAAGGFNVYPTVWSVPPPFRGGRKQAELWVQVLTWQEMDEHGVLTWLDRETWKASRR